MPLSRLRLAAAKYSLNLARSEELTEVANVLLDEGIYSHALGELATSRYPIMREVAPLFESALRELTVPIPSKEDAVRILVREYIFELVEGCQTPFKSLLRLWTELYQPLLFDPVAKEIEYYGKCQNLISCFYEYEDIMTLAEEEYVGTGEGRQRLAAFDRQVTEFAATWMRENSLIRLDPTWLAWCDKTVPKLAQAIYDECAFDRLPILADALEEAGCTDADILDHCRQAGEHVRGCWIVDLILGKS